MNSNNKAARHRKRNKLRAIEEFGGKCNICGYNKSPAALVFHHRDPTEKEIGPAKLFSYKWETILEELNKCDLLCSNCHMELHDNLRGIDNWVRQTRDSPLQMVCQYCEQTFFTTKSNKKYCSMKCFGKTTRKVDRPNKETLSTLLENHTWVQIASMYGVSDNAVRKWAKQYGLIK